MNELRRILDSIPNRKFRTKNLFEGLINASGAPAQDGVNPTGALYNWRSEALTSYRAQMNNFSEFGTPGGFNYQVTEKGIEDGDVYLALGSVVTNQAMQLVLEEGQEYDVTIYAENASLAELPYYGKVKYKGNLQGLNSIARFDPDSIFNGEGGQFTLSELVEDFQINELFLRSNKTLPSFWVNELMDVKMYNERDVLFGQGLNMEFSFVQKPVKGVLTDVFSEFTFFDIDFYDTVEQDWNGVGKYYFIITNTFTGESFRSDDFTFQIADPTTEFTGGENSSPAIAPANIPALLSDMLGKDYRLVEIVEEALTQATEDTPDYTKAFELIEALPGKEYREEAYFLRSLLLQGITQ